MAENNHIYGYLCSWYPEHDSMSCRCRELVNGKYCCTGGCLKHCVFKQAVYGKPDDGIWCGDEGDLEDLDLSPDDFEDIDDFEDRWQEHFPRL